MDLATISTKLPGALLGAADGMKPRVDEAKLKKTCTEFEAIFIQQMVKTMRQAVPQSGLLGGGSQQEIYQSLFDQEVSKQMARGNGIGIWKTLYQKIQEQTAMKGAGDNALAGLGETKSPGLARGNR